MKHGAFGVGISAKNRAGDLTTLGEELDMIEALGVDLIELPTFDYDLVIGGRVRAPQLFALKTACAGRAVAYSVHGPLAINLMDGPTNTPRHIEVLEASLDVAAAVGAVHYVLHSGLTHETQAAKIEDAYARQRELLAEAGELARARNLIICVETLFEYDGWKHASSPKRLAQEIAIVDHPHIMATIDFSHSYIKLDADGRRESFVEEIAALAPVARHLHVHDSFGRQDDLWAYTQSERLAYGNGDLHLPVGWGDIPWTQLLEACEFPEGVVFNIELDPRYWYAARECVDITRGLAGKARIAGQQDRSKVA
ncbi:endonuclease 4 [Ensifer adhaerens]|uniref:sugar phosphate isomerase/epimerase family protein n=1 Tax=Ensifer adhaerens TaxID=106592 RepID=UPI0015684DB7|nr:sugar phosphate isomerase/epimerase [Ensifer adhaerens]NRP20183.1 endonuclease 4 [Ensifer adhaerens]